MRIDIRVHTDQITPNDQAIFAALAALTPGTPTPTTAVLNGEKETSEVSPEPAPKTAPARPAARKAAPAPVEPAPVEPAFHHGDRVVYLGVDPAPTEPAPTESKLAAAKRELTEEVTKLARSGPEGRAKAKKALISAGVERVSEVKTLTVAKAVLAALAEDDEADDLA